MSQAFTEFVVELTAVTWLKNQGWPDKHGSEIAPCEREADRPIKRVR